MPPRAKKDPDAPKNARSAYIYFVQDKSKEVKAANPDMKQPDIMREVGAAWRELSDAEKAPYTKLAAADKERANQEKAAYAGGRPAPKKPGKAAAKQPAKPVQQEAEEDSEEGEEVEDDDLVHGDGDRAGPGGDEEGEDESP